MPRLSHAHRMNVHKLAAQQNQQSQPAPTPAVIPQATGGGVPAGGVPAGGVRSDNQLFNRLFGQRQDGGYIADQVIANTMQNRDVLPSPVGYSQPSLSPNIQRRMDLMTASNPVDALRNPPAGPSMARDNGQSIARNQPQGLLVPWTGPGPNPMQNTPTRFGGGGKMPQAPRSPLVPPVVNTPVANPPRSGKLPRGIN